MPAVSQICMYLLASFLVTRALVVDTPPLARGSVFFQCQKTFVSFGGVTSFSPVGEVVERIKCCLLSLVLFLYVLCTSLQQY